MAIIIPQKKSRVELAASGLGVISQTFDRQLVASPNLLTSGVLALGALGLRAGDVVTNVCVICTVVGSGQTLVKLGLYKKDGTKLAGTADVKADFATGTGVKVEPLTAPYTVPADDAYFAAILGVGGTQPTLGRASASSAGSFAVGANQLPYAGMVGQTDLPANATFAQTGLSFWFGVS